MKKNSKGFLYIMAGLFLIIGTYSCKKDFEENPVNAVAIGNSYQNVQDANAAVIGIYGQVLTLANQYEILNELRADLLDVTPNANQDLIDINQHNVQLGNAYADPTPFYSVINNCNDALEHFVTMQSQKLMTSSEFTEHYTDIISVRSWVYFQLAIHYGSVPYLTRPVNSPEGIIFAENVPKLSFNQMLDTLIYTMKQTTSSLTPSQLLTPYNTSDPEGFTGTYDIADLQYLCINKSFLLAELYLWAGQYYNAAFIYRNLMSDKYVASSLSGQYYRKMDAFAWIGGNWLSQFTWPNSNAHRSDELIWAFDYNNQYAPYNVLDPLFNNTGGAKYLLKPSQVSIDNWYTYPGSGVNFDPRGQYASWTMSNGQPVVYKIFQFYNSTFPVQQAGRWYIWRESELWLHYEEAANRVGLANFALKFLNGGPHYFNWAHSNNQSTTYLPYPFDFDSRTTNDQITIPGYINGTANGNVRPAGEFLRSTGIRARVFPASNGDTTNNFPVLNGWYKKIYPTTPADSIVQIENIIIDEGALEQAYEGQRWPDLLRIAMRRNDPSYLANRVSAKFTRAGNPGMAAQVQAKLMDPNNWFLPFPTK